jgi:hypothetical protein
MNFRAQRVCQHALMSLADLTACSRLMMQQPLDHSGLVVFPSPQAFKVTQRTRRQNHP